jgi:hypothetical protein
MLIAIIVMFVGSALILLGLIAPVIWSAVVDIALRPVPTYEQCDALKDDAARLGCYDRIARQTPRTTKGPAPQFGTVVSNGPKSSPDDAASTQR